MNWFKQNIQGILFAFVIALISTWLGSILPIVGGPVFAIVIGIIINNVIGKPKNTLKGIGFTSKKILQWAIIVLGAGLSFTKVLQTGMDSLSVTFFTLSAAFISAYVFGKLLGIPSKLKSLIGVGTAICGGSAIAAIAPIIEADEMEIAYSISTIFLFNIIAVLIFPPLGHLLHFSDKAFGLWAGTAINDTSSVVAAGYAYSNAAGSYATIVKLTRATLIIPISIIFSIVVAFKKKKEAQIDNTVNFSISKIFPWFILWFLVASLLNTLGLFKGNSISYINALGKFMIVMALSAIGLSSDFKKMMKNGVKPIFLGLIVWFTVAIVSIAVQVITKQM
ncbi:putative sulfate exporter family transporter [Clostridium tagluense]|uniref:YeiH family protein n=1 Tax=Clostridium tagluense TaxID=360422 RepID=UPI001C0D7506|nr:putative sulfate exporter family transporter [Clostridium tagluense]MBU3127340.1 putative sulfate exporter family transporter [Clostridium tagluense]MCB2311186.1 putative sulfate exporter family transporter [Clostridium tagluense]MCB2315910.1 putative sulfate exporter family transporter [Clostridium tagluense]MCB2320743.1 putative sulfate exporter family transporter [Clostridium tagluense]MCB2325760.1 putative sulfate exporter family transporter [Clostridium tagluense]